MRYDVIGVVSGKEEPKKSYKDNYFQKVTLSDETGTQNLVFMLGNDSAGLNVGEGQVIAVIECWQYKADLLNAEREQVRLCQGSER